MEKISIDPGLERVNIVVVREASPQEYVQRSNSSGKEAV